MKTNILLILSVLCTVVIICLWIDQRNNAKENREINLTNKALITALKASDARGSAYLKKIQLLLANIKIYPELPKEPEEADKFGGFLKDNFNTINSRLDKIEKRLYNLECREIVIPPCNCPCCKRPSISK